MQRPNLLYMTRRGRAAGDDLPIFSVTNHHHHRRRTLSDNCIHIIPIMVLLCLFILWWFCYPVNLEVKDGRVTVIPKVEKPISPNETRVDLAFLAAAATSPHASISHILIVENQTVTEPPSGTN